MRLGDLDELKTEFDIIANNSATKEWQTLPIKHIKQIIDKAPTVEERSQSEWIPVSERLPEDMQRVLIWFEYYRYGDFNCMYQTYGFGYVCDGKWSPFINGETGWQDYRVIAWQPLPEPYKEECDKE